jgi:chromosome partitioning protein
MGQTAMHTIATVSRKGGTGKSTIAIGLAVAAIEAGHWVCVLEADPLGSVSNWRRRRTSEEPTVETVRDGYTPFHRIPELARRGVTLTIIDTAGGWSEAARAAMAEADFCLIPVRPSLADIEAAPPTLAAVRESGKPFAFVLNQVQPRSARLNAAAGSLGERAVALKIANVLALPAGVMRNDQQDALGMGRGITEYAPSGKSAKEIRELWQCVSERLRASQADAEAAAETHATLPAAPAGTIPGLCVAVPLAKAEAPLSSAN